MSFLQAILLGIIQGLTEFLPISSSAHLVLVPYFLGWQIPEEEAFIFNVLVQNGTLLAVIIYFWKDLIAIARGFFQALFSGKPFSNPEARMAWYLVLATIPAGLFGLTVKDAVEAAFGSPAMTGVFLFVTAGILTLVEWFGKRQRGLETMNWKDALIIGGFQAISIFPGVSRSGSTIAGGMARNFDRRAAARFSFLMSIPVLLAAGLLETVDMLQSPNLVSFLPLVVAGLISAAVFGYLSIRWLISYLMRHSLRVFAIYCVVLGALTLLVTYLKG